MQKKWHRSAGSVLALIVIMACSFSGGGAETPADPSETPTGFFEESGSGVGGSETTPVATPANGEPETLVSSEQCSNPYYPVKYGATWNYQDISSISGTQTFTDTITAVRADGYTLTSQFEGVTRTQEWSCKPEGLLALQMGGGLTVNTGAELKIDTQSASGVTYPSQINPGDTWQHTIEFTGTMDMAGQSGQAAGTSVTNFTAIGLENVTVPPGSFNAMKIQYETTLAYTVTVQGLTVPVTLTSTGVSWFAANTGWIKSESSGTFADTSFTDKIELQWYNLPQQ